MQATNGLDPTRRLHVLGYCRCVSSLSEVVEAAVLQRGGEVFWQDLRAHRCATHCGCSSCRSRVSRASCCEAGQEATPTALLALRE